MKRLAWPLIAFGMLAAACSRDPRWTLWKIEAGGAVRQEAGLERQVCETLRDRGERDARAADELLHQLQREVVSLGGKPGPSPLPPRYRCWPDGEGYE